MMTERDLFFGRERREAKVSDAHVDDEKIRRLETLRPLEPARIRCLKCERLFNSWDRVLNRRCNRCKAEDDYDEVYLEELREEECDELMDTALIDGEDD